jgi:hypothetical protein
MELNIKAVDAWLANNNDDEELANLLQTTKSVPSDEIEKFRDMVNMEELQLGGSGVGPHLKARIRTVMEELVCGYSTLNIWDKYAKEWNVCKSTVYHYAATARKIINSELLTKDSDIRNDLLAKYNHLYKKQYEQGKYRDCKDILDSITKLTQHVKMDITSNGEPINVIRLVEVAGPDAIEQIEITPHEEI